MAGISVEIHGLDGLQQRASEIAGGLGGALADAVAAEAEAIRRDEAEMVPVDTGELRESIYVVSTGDHSAEVHVGALHGIWIEFGRVSADAQPYAQPAAERSRSRWPEKAAEAARGVLE